jgi:hypothetical protein
MLAAASCSSPTASPEPGPKSQDASTVAAGAGASQAATTATTAPSLAVSSGAPPAAPAGALLPLGRSAPGGARAFVGRVRKNEVFSFFAPLELCVRDEGKLFKNPPVRLESRNLVAPAPALAGVAGKIVVAYGKERPLKEALAPLGPCGDEYGKNQPLPQMRSDWISPEGGYTTTRAKLDKLSFIDATWVEIVVLHEVVGRAVGERTIRVKNPFDAPLVGLEIKAHYEGGSGKPMPRFKPQKSDLPPGGHVDVVLPLRIDETGAAVTGTAGGKRGDFTLESIDLALDRPEILVDASIFIEDAPPAKRR